MEASLRTVVDKRPKIRRLTFCIPIDLPDARAGRGKSARQRFEDAKASWKQRIPGAERVKIDLWQAGDILQRLNAPEHRGKQWFFWERELFDVSWCEEMLEVVERAAGERYTPEAHVELPVGRAIDGLARSAWIAERFASRHEEVRRRTQRLVASHGTGLGVARAVAHARHLASEWQAAFGAVDVRSGRGLDVGALTELTQRASSACSAADPPPAKRKRDRQRAEWLRHHVWQCELAYAEMLQLLRSGAMRAAEAGVLLLKGDAGQGKTHLLIDGARRLVREGQPAAVLLASRVDPNAPWTSIAEAFGVPASGRDTLLGAMEAAGEAAGAPFVLVIDALNERPDAEAWAAALPVLLAELARTPWVVLAVSVRSGYEPLVLPEGGLHGRAAIVVHEGFVQREAEALERYFEHYGIEQPRVPLLSAEFTNPLFLKALLREPSGAGRVRTAARPLAPDRGVRQLRCAAPASRDASTQARPRRQRGGRRLRAFALALADRGTDTMERGDAAALLDQFAPQRVEWPDTMLGRMLDEGVLADDLAYEWRGGKTQRTRVVRFTYQRLADHSIVGYVLGRITDADALRDALAPGAALRKWISEAPSGWLKALSMQVPERFGVELIDATEWQVGKGGREVLLGELIDGLSWREPDSITLRTLELVEEATRLDDDLAGAVEETMLRVAAIPEHPLNAERLHATLVAQPMPDRDAGWGIRTYHAYADGGALERLARWAARGPHPAATDDVIVLAALPLMWMLGSPNRFARGSTRAWSRGSSCSQAQSSMPTSRRRPPLPRRTSSDPRRGSRSASASASASQNPQASVPQHDDQLAQPVAVDAVTGVAHHADDLLDRQRIGGVAHPLVARRPAGVELRQGGGRATAAGGIEQLGHDPPRESETHRACSRASSHASGAHHRRRARAGTSWFSQSMSIVIQTGTCVFGAPHGSLRRPGVQPYANVQKGMASRVAA
jgi:hypothetical protein